MDKKAVFFVADGLGGRPSDLNGKTCLEAAKTPKLDGMAKDGINGLLHPIKIGVRSGSDTAHLSLFGYDPEEVYTGRGVFEASGIGMEVRKEDICFRTNFATVDEDMIVKDRRAGRITERQEELEKILQEKLTFEEHPEIEIKFKTSNQHRGALIIRGNNLSDQITDTDPHDTNTPIEICKPLKNTEKANKTADLVNEITKKSYKILKEHEVNKKRKKENQLPASGLLLRGASKPPNIEPFQEKYGLKGTAVAAGALYLGVASQIGLKTKKPEGVTGGLDTRIEKKIEAAVKELETEKDFVFIHVKGTDNAAHDHDAEAKKGFIEKIDESIGILKDKMNWEVTHFIFTGDHTTPPQFGDHTSEPVPILYYGKEVRTDEVGRIGERTSAKGDLGNIIGQNVLPILFNYNNWLKKFGS